MVDPSDDDALARGEAEPDEGWVPIAEAAATTGCAESWLLDRCRDGRLPSRPGPGAGRIVPLATVRDFVEGRISD